MRTDRSFRVGDWEVRPQEGRLAAGGESRTLEPRAMEVLVLLAENAGRIVSHERFLETIWAGRFVQPNILAQAIHSVRRALGDSARNPRYIRTVSRRGYQLVAEVEWAEPEETTTDPGEPEGATEFVGRQAELGRLATQLRQAVGGRGRLGLVSGEAGSGKSFLLQEAVRRGLVDHADLIALAVRCSSLTGSESPFHPFGELLEELAGELEGTWSGSLLGRRARRVHRHREAIARVVVETAPRLLATLLSPGTARGLVSIARGEPRDPPRAAPILPAERGAGDIHRAYATTLKGIATDAPLLLVIDDAQWMDAASAGLLVHLARQLSWSPVLLLVAWRPEGLVDGRGGERPLARALAALGGGAPGHAVDLDRSDGAAFVDALVDAEPNRLDRAFRRRLHRQTGGHALFTGELLADLKRRGLLRRDAEGRWTTAEEIDWSGLPDRIEAAVEARLATVRPELRQILPAAALQGEEFAAEVVAAVVDLPIDEVRDRLRKGLAREHRLIEAVGLRRGLSVYRFRHVLVQRAIAATVDQVDRPRLHGAIGETLEELAGEERGEIAVELFHQFAAADRPRRAARYAVLGAERAAQRSGYEDAVALCRRALELLAAEPPAAGDDTLELDAQLALGAALQASRGYTSPELLVAMERARELALGLDDRARLYGVLRQLVSFYGARGDFEAAHSLAARCLELARRDGEPDPLGVLIGRWMRGWIQVFEGRVEAAGEDLRFVVESSSATDERRLRNLCGIDPAVTPRAWLSWALWLAGRSAEAFEVSDESLDHGERGEHPHSLAVALYTRSILLWWAHRREPIAPLLDRLRDHADRHGLAFFQVVAEFLTIALDQWRGRGDGAGMERLDASLDRLERAGLAGHRTCLHLIQAELLEPTGDLGGAIAAAERGRRHAAAIGEAFCEPELQRIEALARSRDDGGEAAAVTDLRRAVERAGELGLWAWEGRALVDLANLSPTDRPGCLPRLAELLERAPSSLPEPLAERAERLLAPEPS